MCLNLDSIANVCAIVTSLVAVFGYGSYRYDLYDKRRALEIYLKSEKETALDKGQRTILHLIAKLGLTEAQILQASFSSKRIKRVISVDKKTGMADELLLEYDERS